MLNLFTIIFFLIGMIYDLKYRRIPNWLSYAGVLISVCFNIYQGTLFPQFVLNCILVLIFFGHGFYFRYIGGGDIKLLLCAGGWLVNIHMLVFILLTLISGAIASILYNIDFQNFRSISISNCFSNIWSTDVINRIRMRKGKRIPYAICIFVAYLCVSLLMYF